MIASGPTHATAENLKAEAYQKLKMSPSNVTPSSVRPRTLFRTSAALFTAVSNQAATPVAANTFIFFGSLYDLEVGVPMMICGLLIILRFTTSNAIHIIFKAIVFDFGSIVTV